MVGKNFEAVLKERGVTSTVTSMPAASLNGPVNALAFSAATPKVVIEDIEFSGASAAQIPALQKAVTSIVGSDYRQNMLKEFSTNTLRPIYLNRGYLHVAFQR